ncbi:MAG: histidine phosphatase family protein [Gammaproteobacteria bacterium]|nr:MAG: histidine phosphatase family protein [Gammaproteobacteria bacterium]UTW43848.1 histidine phosphatase family protein [bacterium SCSIO 12844]
MKKLTTLIILLVLSNILYAQPTSVYIIRHGEKPKTGNQLTCKGFHRALKLSQVMYEIIGKASRIYVPKLEPINGVTEHARMFQTATPYAIAHGVDIDSSYSGTAYDDVVKSVNQQTGIVLIVWDHSAIQNLAKAFGVKNPPKWKGKNFDSIWIINPKTGDIKYSRENIKPSSSCVWG